MSRNGLLPALLPLFLGGCLLNTAPVDIPDAEVRVLFIGNSLTYTNDLPKMVQRLAAARGRELAFGVLAEANVSLEDHWYAGAANVIAAQAPDFVILQQGPSSLPANQVHLRHWAEQYAGVIRQAGGEPVLYMVWPGLDRLFAFDDVWRAYHGAAEAADGRFAPAGQAWRKLWARDPLLATYGVDGFHPSSVGSMVAALAIYTAIFNAEAELVTCPFGAVNPVSAATMAVICAAVEEALQETPPVDGGKSAGGA